ncbi:hypothetical protein V1227_18695 [Lentzea sp. DG1S-22]|uniref:hypothetical protein n=1 Tax=Lentzea sp. DG1S-22 TaxID=3108822 RepID=UPI002E75B80C|nr:hypothetical protein [Lentzea sp. DG1S-22]WVH84684.1 hypothetical protein V1227_18695 [Lentzea sp. DG1S-22]
MAYPNAPSPTRAERIERGAQVLILGAVGCAAGAVSFTHVHEWSMIHLPAATPDAFGWVNAAVSELVPIAALLTIRQRRRSGRGTTYPLAILVGASLLSLAAQLAVATPSPSGWLLSSVPTLAFMALTKLVLSELPVVSPSPIGQPDDATLSELPEQSKVAQVPVAQVPRRRAPEVPVVEPKAEVPPQAQAPVAERVTPEVPAADIVPIEQAQEGKRKRVPSDVLRARAMELLDSPSKPTKAAVAAELGVSDRRLRQVLNATDGEERIGA